MTISPRMRQRSSGAALAARLTAQLGEEGVVWDGCELT
jgi:hypothetical protein